MATLNGNSNHFNQTRSIRMQILTIRKGFKAFECKFEPFEPNFKDLNAILNIRMQILIVRKGFEAFECNFEPFEPNLKHSNQILTIQKGLEAIERDSNAKSNHLKQTRSI